MLTEQDIHRMYEEMGLLDTDKRTRFAEWSKMSLKPESAHHPTIIRIVATTDANKDFMNGELERNS